MVRAQRELVVSTSLAGIMAGAMFRFRIRTRRKTRRKRASTVTKHYKEHKEAARQLILARLEHFNQYYQLEWNRVAIRNQRRCWGSCSSKKNLNFSYKILFLPPHLQDYIVVHEMCHLVHMNHGADFWELVAQQLPECKTLRHELRNTTVVYNSDSTSITL